MTARSIALALAFSLLPFSASFADEPTDTQEIVVPPRAAPPPPPAPEPVVVREERPVTAPPPPFVELESRSIGAGIGVSWGSGTLTFEGEPHPFRVKGVSVGELGASRLVAEGDVRNLAAPADFAGTYVVVEAGAAAGRGASALAMRNEKGVVVSLRSDLQGASLQLGAEALRIALE